MLPLANLIPGAGRDSQKSFAAWPVWSGSTTKTIRYQPMPKKTATRIAGRDARLLHFGAVSLATVVDQAAFARFLATQPSTSATV
jgi:hypothetical protein